MRQRFNSGWGNYQTHWLQLFLITLIVDPMLKMHIPTKIPTFFITCEGCCDGKPRRQKAFVADQNKSLSQKTQDSIDWYQSGRSIPSRTRLLCIGRSVGGSVYAWMVHPWANHAAQSAESASACCKTFCTAHPASLVDSRICEEGALLKLVSGREPPPGASSPPRHYS